MKFTALAKFSKILYLHIVLTIEILVVTCESQQTTFLFLLPLHKGCYQIPLYKYDQVETMIWRKGNIMYVQNQQNVQLFLLKTALITMSGSLPTMQLQRSTNI